MLADASARDIVNDVPVSLSDCNYENHQLLVLVFIYEAVSTATLLYFVVAGTKPGNPSPR